MMERLVVMGRKDKSLEDKAYNYLHDMIIQHKLQAGKEYGI